MTTAAVDTRTQTIGTEKGITTTVTASEIAHEAGHTIKTIGTRKTKNVGVIALPLMSSAASSIMTGSNKLLLVSVALKN